MFVLISFLFTYVIIYVSLPLLNKFLLDIPNARSSHLSPKPTGGGFSFVLVATILMTITNNYLPLLCLPLAISGFIDDLFNINFKIRYLIQFIVGICILFYSQFLVNNQLNYNHFLEIILTLFLAFLITSIINFSNFMDGMDGLLSSSLIVVFITAAFKIDSSAWILVGALLAFLIWNWSPSKLFMGDVGSTFLGAILIGLALMADSWQQSLMIMMPSIPLLGDACICVIRRFFAQEDIFKAHSLHLFQRLYQAGWTHSRISINYFLSTFFVSIGVYFDSWIIIFMSLLVISIYAFYLERKVAIPFKLSILKSRL